MSAAQGRHPQVADTRADIFAVAHTLARVAESRGGFPCVRPHTRRFPPRNPRFTFDADFLCVCDCWTGGEAHSFPYLSIPYLFFYPFLSLVSLPTVFTVKSIAYVPAWECLRVWKRMTMCHTRHKALVLSLDQPWRHRNASYFRAWSRYHEKSK